MVRFVDGGLEVVLVEPGGHVDEGGGRGGDGDALALDHVEVGAPVNEEAVLFAASTARHRNFDGPADDWSDPPHCGGARMAQRCARPAPKHRRHPTPELGKGLLSDGVHARIDDAKTSGVKPVPDGRFGEAQFHELPSRDHAVLTLD